ncbi:alpha-amylase family glycosyl hydrolase [Cryomorphaceae bacterium 1068]|nr:alpha-amylase family glycosyl hydrolase [Cryomorphaceae bacterium 1068]
MKKWIYAFGFFVFNLGVFAQVVTIDPPFPTINDDVTVTFHATEGNGQLVGVVPVYAHTGVIIEGLNGWQNVQGNWGTADPNVVMTFVGPNTHQISYNIIDFYGLTGDENIEQLSFVFRNTNGSLEGKNADGSDIFIDVYPAGEFSAGITTPSAPEIFLDPVTDYTFLGESNANADLTLYLNDDIVASESGVSSIETSIDLTVLPTGQQWLWMEADNGIETLTDSVYVIIQSDPVVSAPPPGVIDGINYIDDNTVVLQLFAPNKDFVYVLGDFNNWEFNPDYFMNVTPEGDRYWLEIPNLVAGQEYRFQYSIDQEDLRVADVYCEKILDPWNDPFISEETYPGLIEYPEGLTSEIVGVLQTAQEPYDWQVEDFQRPPSDQLVIYELLVRDFVEDHSYQSLIDTLTYFERLGVNAIQLMPIMEFEGNISWGYNPMFYFAPDKYYGTADKLKEFIDECHQRGIAVILDQVFNHSFGQNPQVRMYSENGAAGPPTAENPWFNVQAQHPFNVGYDYNHDSPHTQAFVNRNLRFWIEEYKFDGFRFDLSKGFTQNFSSNVGQWNQYDQDRVDHWTRIRDEIYSYDDEVYLILEHLGDNPEETVLANNDFMLWGKMTEQYNQNSMGYSSNANLNWADYQVRGWGQPNLVSYAESHDEERLMFKNLAFGNSSGDYNVTDLNTALARQEAVAAFLYPHRGPKMIWQFGELGYEFSINLCEDGVTIEEGCRTNPKPIRWDYQEVPARERLFKVTAALIKLKLENEAFRSDNYTWDVSGLGKRLIIQHPEMDVVIIANFEVTPISIVPGFTQTGTWYDYFTGESIVENDLNNPFLLEPGEYRIYTTVELETPDLSLGIEEADFVGGSLDVPYPNPFSDFTQLSFTLDQSAQVDMAVVDLQGRVVRNLASGNFAQGNHMQRWNGRDNAGAKVASGLYLMQLRTEKGVATAKVMVDSK